MKIKHSLYLMLLIFSLVPLYIFGGFMIYENDRKVEEILKENLTVISGTQIMNIKSFCEARKESMEIIARYELVWDAVLVSLEERPAGTGQSREYLNNMMAERKAYNSYIVSISVVNRDFGIVASSEAFDDAAISDLKNVEGAYQTGEFYIGNMYERDTDDGVQRIVAAYQGIWFKGELIGYVVEEIAVDYFDQYRSGDSLWQDGTLYILDGKDALITAGTPKEDTREEFVTTEEERESYSEAWNALDLEKNPSGEFGYEVGGIRYITYYSNLDYCDWSIRITVNLSSHIQSTSAYRLLLGLTILCASFLLLVVNYFLSRKLTYPIDKIVGTLNQVKEEQNYTLRVESGGRDELGFLAGEVNELLEYIEKEDIEEKKQQRYLRRKAECDPLTGICNKKAIEEQMLDMVQQAVLNGERIVVGFVDIDDFRDYNTNYGHLEGDRVIQFVASVLQEEIRGIVGRNGGDEFVFCILNAEDLKTVEELIKRVLKRLNAGILSREAGRRLSVPCSIGIVADRGSHLSYSALMRAADEAMYTAKEKGKNTYYLIDRENAVKETEEWTEN